MRSLLSTLASASVVLASVLASVASTSSSSSSAGDEGSDGWGSCMDESRAVCTAYRFSEASDPAEARADFQRACPDPADGDVGQYADGRCPTANVIMRCDDASGPLESTGEYVSFQAVFYQAACPLYSEEQMRGTCDYYGVTATTVAACGGEGGGGGGEQTSTSGELTFWTASDLGCGPIQVNVSGLGSGTITSYHSSSLDCGASGTASFASVTPGSYSYTASCSDGEWSGSIDATAGGCTLMELRR